MLLVKSGPTVLLDKKGPETFYKYYKEKKLEHFKVSLTNLCLVSHKRTFANSVNLDQTPQNATSDQGLHCLHLIQKCI